MQPQLPKLAGEAQVGPVRLGVHGLQLQLDVLQRIHAAPCGRGPDPQFSTFSSPTGTEAASAAAPFGFPPAEAADPAHRITGIWGLLLRRGCAGLRRGARFSASRRRPRFPQRRCRSPSAPGGMWLLTGQGSGHRLPASPRRPGPERGHSLGGKAGRQPLPRRRGGAGTAPSGLPQTAPACTCAALVSPRALWHCGGSGSRGASSGAARTAGLWRGSCHGLWRGRTFSPYSGRSWRQPTDLVPRRDPAAPWRRLAALRGAPWQPPTSRRHDCIVARGWMHPLIGSSAAAAQEPPTLAGAPTPISP